MFVYHLQGQLSRCYSLEQYEAEMKPFITPDININQFLEESLPDKDSNLNDTDKTGLPYLGSGEFGRVYQVNVFDENKVSTVEAAVKIGREKLDKKEFLENEAFFLQNFSAKHPLFLPQFYGCVDVKEPYHTTFLFTEKMYISLGHPEIVNDFSRTEQIDVLEKLLMMALGVQTVHKEKMGHFDIKPDNFAIFYKNGIAIIKLLDFGFTDYPGPYLYFFCASCTILSLTLANVAYLLPCPCVFGAKTYSFSCLVFLPPLPWYFLYPFNFN